MSNVLIVTGSAGLIGSESVRFFAQQGLDIVGIDNDMRAHFFGQEASTHSNRLRSKTIVIFTMTFVIQTPC